MKVLIEKLVPGGQGIGTMTEGPDQGKKGFFWNALPGENVVKFTTTKKKSSYFEAIAEEIENSSPCRISPNDPCFLSTSPWQIMDYDCELDQKRELLIETFRQNKIEINPATVQTDSQDFHYRNKMEYSLFWDNNDEKIHLSFHQRSSHRKFPIEKSSIERPEIFRRAQEIVDGLNARHEEARKYQTLLLRADQQGNVSGGLFENGRPHPVFNNLTDQILGQTYSYSPNGFFQINLPVYEMALTEIKKHIQTENVLDLYSGVGTIGLSVAKDKNLTLVESNPAAFKELEKNADDFARTVLSKSEEALEFITADQTVILDPPRAGLDGKLTEKLLEVAPEKIVYLSCNPATQARDVKLLLEKYKITSVTPFNFFPRTPHLENLVVLEKA